MSDNWEPQYGDVVRPKGGPARLMLLWPDNRPDTHGTEDFAWYAMSFGGAGYGHYGYIQRIKHVGDNADLGWRLAT